jgi:tetratricopeptide (TPR) repeat protein
MELEHRMFEQAKLFQISSVLLLVASGCTQDNQDLSKNNKSPLAQTQVSCGTVQFGNTYGLEADSNIAEGIAFYHHMTFPEAQARFQKVIDLEPNCMWGYWGKALTFLHPIWPDAPSEEMLKEGKQLARIAVDKAETAREKLFSAALMAYYRGAENKTESERLERFEKYWEKAHKELPDDLEAKAFYVLAHLATIDPKDKSYKKQHTAGELAKGILKEIPDHPAGFHYTIHAYDYPTIADNALDVARRYGKAAPEVPHALHMPTHIFTRIGLWNESIEWNIRSAEAALNFPVDGAVSYDHFHALDYLTYAYLQKGQDEKAIDIWEKVSQLEGPYQQTFPVAYALAAMPARISLERKLWQEAADLKPRQPTHFDWEKFPQFEAMLEFARGLGAARSGDLQSARQSIELMTTLQSKVANTNKDEYWANQIEIQKSAVLAWVLFAEDKTEEAIKSMEASADMESATSKSPVTPGEVLPARELLADMYAELGKHSKAIENYELALKRSPNRLNSLAGAAKSASAIDDQVVANQFLGTFKELTKESTSERVQQFKAAL